MTDRVKPKIVIEDKVPFVDPALAEVAEVAFLPASRIDASTLSDADALITRTRPRLDAGNLSRSPIKVIATATIGTDHIDTDYCRAKGIVVRNVPGCNAPAVAQWVVAALKALGALPCEGEDARRVVGIVGYGNVGSIVARWCRQLGFKVLVSDPPLEEAERGHNGTNVFSTLDDIAREADIITFHTPLTTSGPHPTFHLADRQFFKALEKKPLILNAARGAVIDTGALVEAIDNGLVGGCAIDTWEGEPAISTALLERARVATPHIAGYSLQGKQRAGISAVKAVADTLGLSIESSQEAPVKKIEGLKDSELTDSYDIMADTAALKADPGMFETLRNSYRLRDEPGF